MPFILIPRETGTDTASIWVGAINEQFDPAGVKISGTAGERDVANAWLSYQALNAQQQINYQVITLDNLQPRTNYSLSLLVGGDVKADASITTLPLNAFSLEVRQQQGKHERRASV